MSEAEHDDEVNPSADNYMVESAMEPIPDNAYQVGVDLASGEDVTVVEKFVRIDPDSKWVLVLPSNATYENGERIADRIRKWWNGEEGFDFPIMIVGGEIGFRLVRVDEHEIGPELVDCGAEHCPGHVVGDGERCCEDLYCDCEPDGDFAGQDYRCHHFGG